jgi:cytoskeletal protein RodZ
MSASIGSILQKEREIRGLSLAQVSDEIHIRESYLAELESDDFASFPNPAYARMYFRLYCKFLDIQLTDEIDMLFPASALAGLDDYEYLRNEPVAPPARAPRPKRPRPSLAVMGLTFLVVVLVVGALGLSLVWTAQRVGAWGTQTYSELKALAEKKKEEARLEAQNDTEITESAAAPPPAPVANPEAAAEKVAEAPAVVEATPEALDMGQAGLGGLAAPAVVSTDAGAETPPETGTPAPTPTDTSTPTGSEIPAPAPGMTPLPPPESLTPPPGETSATPPPAPVEGTPPPAEAAPAPAEEAPKPEEKKEPTFAFPEGSD